MVVDLLMPVGNIPARLSPLASVNGDFVLPQTADNYSNRTFGRKAFLLLQLRRVPGTDFRQNLAAALNYAVGLLERLGVNFRQLYFYHHTEQLRQSKLFLGRAKFIWRQTVIGTMSPGIFIRGTIAPSSPAPWIQTTETECTNVDFVISNRFSSYSYS